VGDVRGQGLFVGMEMVTDRASNAPDAARAIEVCERLKARGFLTSNAGIFGNVVKMRPPLVFSEADARAFLPALDATLAELA
jgi:4-aminobutyrate aminotransferase-like enzyme